MKLIKDNQKQINLHPLVIYFVLSSKISKERAEALRKLNNYQGFTRGIFKFQTVGHVGKYSEEVSSELADAIKRNNMLVRLVDDSSGSFCYAVHRVNFNQGADKVEQSMMKFIVDVCRQNIKQLASRSLEQGVTQEKQMALSRMQQSFRDAMNMKGYRRGVWARLTGEAVIGIHPVASIIRDDNTRDIPGKFLEKYEKATKAKNPQYLWSWIESMIDAPGKKTSDEIIKGFYNEEYADALKCDINRRSKPKYNQAITVEIKNMVKSVNKDGREKKEYGFVFKLDDKSFTVFFGIYNATMLYVCTLLRQKMGEKMYLHEFYNNSKGRGATAKFNREKSWKWLESVYKQLFPYHKNDFKEWMSILEKGRARLLNQGKTNIASCIAKQIDSQIPVSYYCSVTTREDAFSDSYYDIMLEPENIIVPDELQFLIRDFNELMGIQE